MKKKAFPTLNKDLETSMRNIININENWAFTKEKVNLPTSLPTDWEIVNLPHTWNAIDGQDGKGEYFRGTCYYVKEFALPKQPLTGGRIFIEIPAAGQQATVYVNGEKVIYHEGGYSLFRADITKYCTKEKNLLVIACSNEYKENVYPQSADFTFYGGLYRGVNLISVPNEHFELEYYGSPGIMVTPKVREDNSASFEISTFVKNTDENFTVLYSNLDKEGKEVAGGTSEAKEKNTITLLVPNAHLWDIDDPYLYYVKATLQRRNEAYDEVKTAVGVRSFSCDPNKGFIINGKEVPLRGVSRHQDKLYIGNALTKEDHYEDARIIKELGANTIRLAHYQHSEDFYNACDELGFIVWAEIPFISVFNKCTEAHENCISQLKELIIQNYNHPSICFWGISNEILIGGISEELVKRHIELNALAKELDKTRLTTIANVSMTPLDSPMNEITDVLSYNHYFGWYGGAMEDNGPWLDKFHQVHPDRCLGLSEYGCEGILTYHGPNPACKDYSEEYQALYHECLAKTLEDRPWVWSSHVWNMFDFGCAARSEGGVSGRNNKGLVTLDRKTKKDSYYIYQAYWSKKPMVHIAGRRYAKRSGESTEVRVYSNEDQVELYLNDKLVEKQKGYRVFVFKLSLKDGSNSLVAKTASSIDAITLEKVDKEPSIYTLPEVNERKEGVANWFKMVGSLDLASPMTFPEGKYSIHDTFEELANNKEAFELVAKAAKLATNFKLEKGNGMWNMMKSFTPEKMVGMMGSSLPKGFLESLNAKLIQIDK